MKNFFLYLFIFIVGCFALIFALSFFWHEFAFKYVFQALTSFSLIIAGIYYIFKKNIKLGLLLFLLSVIMYYLSGILFLETFPSFKLEYGQALDNNLLYDFWKYFLNAPLCISHYIFRTWHFLIVGLLFANAMVLARARENIFGKFIAANLIAFVFVIVVYFMFR